MFKKMDGKFLNTVLATFLALAASISGAGIAAAGIDDDIYDGNVFSIYGSNGALVPPRITLRESLRRSQPALVILYVNDSRDCKRLAPEITFLQSRFGQLVNFIAVNTDALPLDQPELKPYFKGDLPRLLLFDGGGKLVYEYTGVTTAKMVEPYFRKLVANLPPRRSTTVPLQPIAPTPPPKN